MDCDPWPIVWPCDTTSDDPTLVAYAQEAAQSILWGLSGRRYGLCTTEEGYRLPCNSPCAPPYGDRFGPGVQYWLGTGTPRICCRIHLSQRPVRAIEQVVVEGDVLADSEYLLDRDVLMRLGQCWPCTLDCDPPSVTVTYRYGIDVPALGSLAMGELACEILRGITGADCRLPSNAVAITRQGVSVDLGNVRDLYDMGRIGLPLSDAFLRETNPNRLADKSQVFSPDLARRFT